MTEIFKMASDYLGVGGTVRQVNAPTSQDYKSVEKRD